jgi:hypothetical protein
MITVSPIYAKKLMRGYLVDYLKNGVTYRR